MRVLRTQDYREMPWKNGGGTTTEIFVSPAGAGMDDFDWRISMARVEAGGPFSLFAGIDRTLSILEGEGIVLSIGGGIPIELTARSEPLPFAADEETHAVLIGGPVTDLNMMTRRGRATHTVERITVTEPVEIAPDDGTTLLFCAQGQLRVPGESPIVLGPRDTLLVGERARPILLEPEREAVAFLVTISGSGRIR
ncbi:HutD/Ves family protein [Mesorhizobium sp. A556]